MNRLIATALVAVAAIMLAPTARAIDVEESATLGVSPDRVWETIKDFCSIKNWSQLVRECKLSTQSGLPFPLRTLTTDDGAKIVEIEIFHSDTTMTITSAIAESTLPLIDYWSTITVTPLGEERRAEMTWRGRFAAPEGKEKDAEKLIRSLYVNGLLVLQRMFGA